MWSVEDASDLHMLVDHVHTCFDFRRFEKCGEEHILSPGDNVLRLIYKRRNWEIVEEVVIKLSKKIR